MKWPIKEAKRWMKVVAMDHIRDGLYAEGGELLFECEYSDGCDTKKLFGFTLERICGWDDDDIYEAVEEVMANARKGSV